MAALDLAEAEGIARLVRDRVGPKGRRLPPLDSRRSLRWHRVAAARSSGAPDRGDDLDRWTGSPLDQKNLGAYLAGNSPRLFCEVGDPHKWEANIVIDQDEIDFVRPEQEVAIKLDEIRYRTFYTTIDEIGPELKFTPRQLSSKTGGELMSKTEEGGASDRSTPRIKPVPSSRTTTTTSW